MPLPRFDFAPDEWPPLGDGEREGLADAQFETNWKGRQVQVTARGVGVAGYRGYWLLLFFRVAGEQMTWLVCNTSGRPDVFETIRSPQQAVETALEGNYFGHTRMVGEDWLFLHSNGREGCWNGAHAPSRAARFLLPDGASWQDELARPDSDMAFARNWSRLPLPERARRATQWTRGSLEEAEQVVRAVAVVCRMHRHYSMTHWQREFRFVHGVYEQPDARVRRWNRYLQDWFRWQRDAQLSAQHVCVAESHIGPNIELEFSLPTAHEQLEAALFLREWADGKIPPDELRLLVPKL